MSMSIYINRGRSSIAMRPQHVELLSAIITQTRAEFARIMTSVKPLRYYFKPNAVELINFIISCIFKSSLFGKSLRWQCASSCHVICYSRAQPINSLNISIKRIKYTLITL